MTWTKSSTKTLPATAHPEIDSPTFAATLAIFRAYGDAQCGFTDV